MEVSVRLDQIYVSLLGEGDAAGMPAVFVQLAGCYISCDMPAHRQRPLEGVESSVDEILERVKSFGQKIVSVTGGETLLQEGTLSLADRLLADELTVYVETNCTVDLSGIDPKLIKIVDLKCPSNGTCYQIRWKNLEYLGPGDCIKFMISDRGDYVWARDVIKRSGLEGNPGVYLIPLKGVVPVDVLAEWIIVDKLRSRLHLPAYVTPYGVVKK